MSYPGPTDMILFELKWVENNKGNQVFHQSDNSHLHSNVGFQ